MITGALDNGVDAAMLVIGLNAKNRQDMAAGNVAFTPEITGTMAIVRTKKYTSLMVVHAETEEEMITKVREEFRLAGKPNAQFNVYHPDDFNTEEQAEQ